jgi:hypothetical protein
MTAALPALAKLKPNPDWATLPLFDRAGWKRVAFGEFAGSIGERAEPKAAQEEINVGLEHLEPQCLNFTKPEKEMLMGTGQGTFGVAGVARSGGLCGDKAGTAMFFRV